MSKQEFILSFENEQKRRYEEFLFEYRNYSIINEYKFIYQRDGISLDVEYFKDLVFLSKKAARSSLLCSYLPIFHNEDMEIHNDIIEVHLRKPIRLCIVNNFIKKSSKSINIFETAYLAYPTFKHYLSQFDNVSLHTLYHNALNRFENIDMDRVSDDALNILQSYFYSHDLYLNVYENFSVKDNDEFITNIMEHVPLVHYRVRPYVNIFDNLFLHRDNFMFITEHVNLSENTKHLFLQDDLFTEGHYKSITLYQNIFGKNANGNILTLFENMLVNPTYDRVLYLFDYILGLPGNLHMNYFEDIMAKPVYEKFLNIFENNMGSRYGYLLNTFENNNAQKVFTGKLYRFEIDRFSLPIQQLIINEIDSFRKDTYSYLSIFNETISFAKDNNYLHVYDFIGTENTNKYLSVYNYNSFAQNEHKTVTLYNNVLNINKNTDSALYIYQIISFDKSDKYLNLDNTQSFLYSYGKYLALANEILPVMKYYSNLSLYNEKNDFAYLKFKYLTLSNEMISFKDIYKLLYKNEDESFGFLNEKPFYMDFDNLYVEKTSFLMRLHNDINPSQKTNKSFKILLKAYFFEKNPKNLYKNVKNTFFTKISKDVYLTRENIAFEKIAKNINKNETLFRLDKISRFIQYVYGTDFINKYNQNVFINNEASFLFKEYKYTDIDKDYIPDLFKQYYNINNYQSVISINKVNKPMFTSELIDQILKHAKGSGVSNTDTLLDKVNKSIFMHDDLLCDKLMHNANFISLLDTMVIKKRIQAYFLSKDIFINKYPHGTFIQTSFDIQKIRNGIICQDDIFIYRNVKRIFEDKNLFVNKYLQMFTQRDTYITRTISALDVFKQEWINTMRYAFIHQDITTFRSISELYDDNTGIWSFKPQTLDVFDQESLAIEKHGQLYDTLNVIRTNNFPTSFYDQYFLSKDIIINELPCIDEIHKIAKDLEITTNSDIDWAWVYQEDEGFDDPFKIDELLLPENDSRYEDFEDILFNRKTLKPRAPIQIIDDYTFIAKYPNRYPIKDEHGENAYKDIALEYLDVRTSIMRRVFIGYYKLWQDHIFEFAQMTIPQSAKKILDYLYVWILMSFSEEDIPEALRTFRLVRWYLERGIIECSEYYITYEPDDLTSGKLDTTNLDIPSDLMPPSDDIPQNNTMYIDTNRHIITNNPSKLGQEAHITFYIDNKRDTTISFSLHTLTPVYIILNEGLPNEDILEVISLPTTGKMVYNIPYTGDTNTFTIKKLGADNHDNDFFIGNIVIPKMGSNGNLNIEFNPKIQGNKVLNHVSQKVISYMNLYNDNETLMYNLVKGNVHLGEVYEHLLEYWDLHHQDKDKGKRLTIKRT